VHFHGAYADIQHFRNFTVCMPDRHQAKDVTLPGREEIGIDRFFYRLDFSAQSSFRAHQEPLIINSSKSSKGLYLCKRNHSFVQGFRLGSKDSILLHSLIGHDSFTVS